MKWRYFRAGLYTQKKRSHWLIKWPIRKGLGDKKRWLVIGWRCHLYPVERLEQSTNGSSRASGDLQGVNELFLFAEKRIQRFDESRFQDGEMKWSASSSEDREFVLIVMWGTLGIVKKMLTDRGFVKLSETGVRTRACEALTKVEIFLKNSWKCVDYSNFFTKTCLTNHYFSRDPHFVILA